MKKIIGFVVLLGLFSSSVFAGQQYSLETAKQAVVNDNINVSIAYEQYVLVKSQAQSKSLNLLPTISVDMLMVDYQYAVLRSIVPEPQRFFEAAASKDLAVAASINRTIVKRNLLQDLEQTFFLYQYHQEMLESFNKEKAITQEIATRSQEAYDLGTIDFSEYYRTQRGVVSANTQAVNGKQIVNTEEYALKLILQAKNTEALDLAPTNFYNSTLDFPATAEEASTIAVNNSKEVEQFDYLIEAANKQKKGVAVSWISWGGVGFDYFSRLSIAKHEVNKIALNKKKSIYEVKNQVVAQYAQIESQQEKISYQNQLLAMAQDEYTAAVAAQTSLLNSFINTKKAELNLMYAERESSKLKYELELQYIKLKRLLGANMMTNVVPRS
ncbi:TolC family protein [Bacteriovorax sp. PP10]|uniref:TolC family protein n=1 Tax=Bacteriovorax antarcticus TaxID=3088717 RepID=A0ABU5VRN8_9BACT|nr:TolC family protein [Bacteriovorax sp. PP10]MEA9355716.1 TolC family protein [Bacteriovorax sp. PP10]